MTANKLILFFNSSHLSIPFRCFLDGRSSSFCEQHLQSSDSHTFLYLPDGSLYPHILLPPQMPRFPADCVLIFFFLSLIRRHVRIHDLCRKTCFHCSDFGIRPCINHVSSKCLAVHYKVTASKRFTCHNIHLRHRCIRKCVDQFCRFSCKRFSEHLLASNPVTFVRVTTGILNASQKFTKSAAFLHPRTDNVPPNSCTALLLHHISSRDLQRLRLSFHSSG